MIDEVFAGRQISQRIVRTILVVVEQELPGSGSVDGGLLSYAPGARRALRDRGDVLLIPGTPPMAARVRVPYATMVKGIRGPKKKRHHNG